MAVTPTIWMGRRLVDGQVVAALSDGRLAIAGATEDGELTGRFFDIFGNSSGGNFLAGLSNDTAEPLGNPHIVADARAGLSLAFSFLATPDDVDLRATVIDKSGNVGTVSSIAISTARESLDDFAASPGNGSVAAYTVRASSEESDVWISLRDDTGEEITSLQVHEDEAGLQRWSDLAVLANGNIVVVWDSYDPDTETGTLQIAVFDQNGLTVEPERTVGATTNAAFPTVAALANGNAVVAWQDVTDQRMYYKIVDSAGADVSVLRYVPEEAGLLPKVVGLPDGGFVLAWTHYLVDGDFRDVNVAVQVFDAAGNTAGDLFETSFPGEPELLDLTVTPDGRIVVLYNTETQGDEFIILDPRGSSISGNDGDNVIAGSAAASYVNGMGGNDTLYGLAFDDVLVGGSGDDRLDGGGGADTLLGGIGNDVMLVDNAGDLIVERSGEGSDTVMASVDYALKAGVSVEMLRTSGDAGTAPIRLTGNELAQTITGNAGHNVLNDGLGAADTLRGLGGNDVYVVHHAGAIIVEAGGQGTDSVLSSVSFVLQNGISVETLGTTNSAGTTAINLTGNSIGQTVRGNAGSNVIDGKGGADTLTGFGGKDFFVFSSAIGASSDTITDFNVADDTIRLENAIFTKLATTGVLNSALFRSNSTGTAVDGNDYVLYNNTDGKLYYDADGSGSGTKIHFATLTGAPAITSADFVVI